MQQDSIGHGDQRAKALNLVIPLHSMRPPLLRATFRAFDSLYARGRGFRQLDRLQFIHAIRWTLLPPFAPPKRLRDNRTWEDWFVFNRREQRWHLLFESNFDGDWDEYLLAFGGILGPQLNFIVQHCVGYPGMDDLDLFKQWAKSNDIAPDHYASAYSTLTAIDIRQALATDGDPRSPSGPKMGHRNPRWMTALIPMAPDRVDEAIAATRRMTTPPTSTNPTTSSLLGAFARQATVDGRNVHVIDHVHFVRLSFVRQPAGTWLLFTIVHDKAITGREAVRRMLGWETARVEEGAQHLHHVLRCADAVPRTANPDDGILEDLVAACRPRSVDSFMQYCAYSKRTAAEICAIQARTDLHDTWPLPETLT